jgi:hypothetical protein
MRHDPPPLTAEPGFAAMNALRFADEAGLRDDLLAV